MDSLDYKTMNSIENILFIKMEGAKTMGCVLDKHTTRLVTDSKRLRDRERERVMGLEMIRRRG